MIAVLNATLCVFLVVAGQVCWKYATVQIKGEHTSIVQYAIAFISSPIAILGFLVYGVATVYWIILLSKYELSYIYPIFALSYLFSTMFAVFLFHEQLSAYRLIGIGFILLGVVFVTKS